MIKQSKPNNGTMALKILTTDDPKMLSLVNTCTLGIEAVHL